MILDKYFDRPILWDCILSAILSSALYVLIKYNLINIPKIENIISITTDISNISLTSTGFILTLLTVLITFRGYNKKPDNIKDYDSVFQVFFSTKLYKITVDHLKNCIKSLVFIALLSFVLKLSSHSNKSLILFLFNSFSFSILCFTLLRCMLILSKLIDLQTENDTK